MNKLLTLFLFLIGGDLLFGQENNYWSTQYGSKSNLLGGASVATFIDDGAIFYNPATLAFKDSTHISISASAFQVERTEITNAFGKNLNLRDINYNVASQIISGNLHVASKIEFEFILLNRNFVTHSFNKSHRDYYAVVSTEPTNYYDYIGEFESQTKLSEQWGGLAFSYKLNENWGVGITEFLSYRFQKNSQSIIISARDTTNSSANPVIKKVDYTKKLSYTHISCITKLGVVYNGKMFNSGLVVTLPSTRIAGYGKLDNYAYMSNLSFMNPPQTNILTFKKGQPIKVTYKTPWSVSGGFSYKIRRTFLHLTSEYFAPIKEYNLYPAKNETFMVNPFVERNTKSDTLISYEKSAKQVLNFAIGADLFINDQYQILLGFHSDFTNSKSKIPSFSQNIISETGFNIWHGDLGVSYTRDKTVINLGFIGSIGKRKNWRGIGNFKNPGDENYLIGVPENNSTINYSRFEVIVGFTY